ncbi:GNAT family N-acetyltransferase [Halonotius terrestris]|uniref:GNAT family N-acetyltransferase n=1 Tax=Halonotius terrestris TaxID=2487750 RepID=A0A8J8P7T9_9EURY|nr:GNAT family N-acetyltransferase [Halonotius terrestris]TQQ81265.1 GNAT family N-acetyltransferase [Halonotius terrestris]
MDSTIRPARASDADRLHRLQSLLPEPTPALLSAAIPDEGPRDAQAATTSLGVEIPLTTTAAFTLLVTVDERDTAVGYVLAVGGSGTHIAELVVNPDHRRAGRGQALLEKVIARTPSPLTVHVAADNDAARQLYERVGFTEIAHSDDQFETSDGLTLRYDPD